MKIAFIFFLLSNNLYAQAIVQKEYISQNNKNIIYYKGADHFGEGTFYYKENNKVFIILTEYLRYGPMLKWLSDTIAEIKIPTGSPNYHAYYFDYKKKKSSSWYNLTIATDTINQNVACLDLEKIVIYDIFTSKIKKEYSIKYLEPMGFLVFCEYECKFKDKNLFYLKWKCPGSEKHKEVNITF